jgi:hypothetical protein
MDGTRNSDVDDLLRRITNTHLANQSGSSSTDQQGLSVKALGGSTNNMLLQMINGEMKCNADAIRDLCTYTRETNSLIEEQNKLTQSLISSINDLSSVLAINAKVNSSNPASELSQFTGKDKIYYYKGSKLANKYNIYACIIAHIVSMVYNRMQRKAIMYSDSVDCSFEMLTHAIRIVCTTRCNIPSIAYDNKIDLTEKNTPIIESICPHIASTKQFSVSTLLENKISKIYNDSTSEDIFVHVRLVAERLRYLHGILSPKQMDALKSLKSPLVVIYDGEEPMLNIDESKWSGSNSHPVANMVAALAHKKKLIYMERIVLGDSPAKAYSVASTDTSSK